MTEVDDTVTSMMKMKNRLRDPKKIIVTKSHPEYNLASGVVLNGEEVARNGEYFFRFLFQDGSEGFIPVEDAIKYNNKDAAILSRLTEMLSQLQVMTQEVSNLKNIIERNQY